MYSFLIICEISLQQFKKGFAAKKMADNAWVWQFRINPPANPHTHPAGCLSKIRFSLFSGHQKLLLDNMREQVRIAIL